MAYTPELSLKSSQTLRRIAWALDKPMTETLELIVRNFSTSLDRKKICSTFYRFLPISYPTPALGRSVPQIRRELAPNPSP